jgi:hypothetical protein
MPDITIFQKMLEQKPTVAQASTVSRIFSEKKRLLDDEVMRPRMEPEVRKACT